MLVAARASLLKSEHSSRDKPPASVEAGAAFAFEVLKNRSDFLRAAKGRSKGVTGFHFQAFYRGDEQPPRVGFTCSKKVGNAVARNRAKRRLREIARLQPLRAGWDYVLIGRKEVTATRGFEDLRCDLRKALEAVH